MSRTLTFRIPHARDAWLDLLADETARQQAVVPGHLARFLDECAGPRTRVSNSEIFQELTRSAEGSLARTLATLAEDEARWAGELSVFPGLDGEGRALGGWTPRRRARLVREARFGVPEAAPLVGLAVLREFKRQTLEEMRRRTRILRELPEGSVSPGLLGQLEEVLVGTQRHLVKLSREIDKRLPVEERPAFDRLIAALDRIERRSDVIQVMGSYARARLGLWAYRLSNPRHQVSRRVPRDDPAVPTHAEILDAMGPATGVLEDAA